jgi:hypothetical protein
MFRKCSSYCCFIDWTLVPEAVGRESVYAGAPLSWQSCPLAPRLTGSRGTEQPMRGGMSKAHSRQATAGSSYRQSKETLLSAESNILEHFTYYLPYQEHMFTRVFFQENKSLQHINFLHLSFVLAWRWPRYCPQEEVFLKGWSGPKSCGSLPSKPEHQGVTLKLPCYLTQKSLKCRYFRISTRVDI